MRQFVKKQIFKLPWPAISADAQAIDRSSMRLNASPVASQPSGIPFPENGLHENHAATESFPGFSHPSRLMNCCPCEMTIQKQCSLREELI